MTLTLPVRFGSNQRFFSAAAPAPKRFYRKREQLPPASAPLSNKISDAKTIRQLETNYSLLKPADLAAAGLDPHPFHMVPAVKPSTPFCSSSMIRKNPLFGMILEEQKRSLDIDKRSLYFCRQRDYRDSSFSPDEPKKQRLILNPGSYLRVTYLESKGGRAGTNTLSPSSQSTFTGVLIGINDRGCNGSFRMVGVLDDVNVTVSFLLFSPLIKKIEILRRAVFTYADLLYLRDAPIQHIVCTANELKGRTPEVLSEETASMSIDDRISKMLPLEIPKGLREPTPEEVELGVFPENLEHLYHRVTPSKAKATLC